ncbi:MAG: helicase-related protein [Cyanobacteria bacterium P01_E01_bin.42]
MPERELIVVKPTNNPNPDAAKILLFLLRQGLRGICFCNGRATIKNLLATLRTEAASQKYPNIEGQTAIFYGGLTGERRSEIISGLQEGRMRCLLSTSALEAGIDLAELDFALIRGWPGSLQGFRQRIGRAGRKQKGLAIFLPLERSPLDRYYAQHPELLLSAPAERVSFNARYPVDLGKHLMCAAVESGIENDRLKRYFGKTAPHIASALLEQGALRKTRGRLWAKGFPHRDVNFRGGLGGSTVRLTNEQTGEAIEEMSLEIAYREAFPGAIYRTQDSNGKMVTYRSLSLDVEARQATLQPIPETSTYTVAESRTDTRILQDLVAPKQLKLNLSEEEGNAFLRLSWGEVSHSISGYQVLVKEYEQTCLNRKCVNYREALPGRKFCPVCGRRSRRAELTKVVDEVEFEQPYAIRFTTPIAQISFDKVVNEYLQKCASRLLKEVESDSAIAGVLRDYPASLLGVHSFGHQILAAFPLVVLGSLNDVNYIVEARNSKDCVGYFYDLSESGNGSAEAIFRHLSKLARAGAALARNCDCQYGCPKCLILSGCPDGNQALLKQMGLFLCDSIASM